MEAKARVEVQRFLDNCEIKGTAAGRKILKALMNDRDSGPGKGVEELSAGSAVQPRDVAKWIRDNRADPVIWHMPDQKYRFASELHAEAAADILNRQSQSSA